MNLGCTGWVFAGHFVHFLAMYLQCSGPGYHPLSPVSLWAEIDVLKQALYSGVDSQIKQQGVDIATLKQAYNQLYTIAANLYSISNSQFTYSAYPTPAATPDRTLKPIAAF